MTAVAASPTDLRLLPAALATWAGTASALHLNAGISLRLAAVATVGAGLGAFIGVLRGRGPVAVEVEGTRSARRLGAPVLVGLLFAAAALLTTGLRVGERDASPLAELAARDAVVGLELTVVDDPRPVAGGFGGQPRVLVAARAGVLHRGGTITPVHARVLVLAEATGWSRLLPGQQLTVSGRLLPATGPDLVAAVLAARCPPELSGRPPWWQRSAGSLRAGLAEASQVLPAGAGDCCPG